MPDEIIPAPESEPEELEEEEEPEEPEEGRVTQPSTEIPQESVSIVTEPVIKNYKLMNDVYYTRPDGVGGKLKAGRILSAIGYDLDRIRSIGGVLAPIIEK
jgi:hypothetical protein